MCTLTLRIVDVYHHFAACKPNVDYWARRNIHGLNPDKLKTVGFCSTSLLIADFKLWLKSFDIISMFANDCAKESRALGLPLNNIFLPPWRERINFDYHTVANIMKHGDIPIFNFGSCDTRIHDLYNPFIYDVPCLSKTLQAKAVHNFHCSLYDTYELYLFYMRDQTRVWCNKNYY